VYVYYFLKNFGCYASSAKECNACAANTAHHEQCYFVWLSTKHYHHFVQQTSSSFVTLSALMSFLVKNRVLFDLTDNNFTIEWKMSLVFIFLRCLIFRILLPRAVISFHALVCSGDICQVLYANYAHNEFRLSE